MAVGKQVQVKLFNREDVLVKTLTDVTLSSFDWVINGGLGQLRLILSRPIDNFGEGSEIDLNFRVEVRVVDMETPPEGVLIYQGYISSYRQLSRPGSENVEVTCLGYQSLFSSRIHQDSTGNTTLSYTSRDPSYIVKDAIEKLAGMITTTPQTVDNTGLSLSYTFRQNTVKEVLDKCIDLAPNGFFWFTDANNQLTYRKVNYDRPDHILQWKKDFIDVEIEKSLDDMTNVVYFTGGGNPNLYRKTTKTSSVTEWGKFEDRITDERVTVSGTADQMATNKLDRFDHPVVKIRIKIIDSNQPGYPGAGANIEEFKPGDVVLLRNLADERSTLWDQAQWDVDFWDFNFLGALANPFIITKITYEYTSISLEIGEFQDIFGREFKSLEDKLATSQYQNLPAAPTAV